jgi:hypothetical protein
MASKSKFAGEIQGKAITPRLKEAMIYLAQSELYTQAPHLLKLLTGQAQSQATFWRLAQWCGEELEDLLPQHKPDINPTGQEVVYCMADGCMLFTDDGWPETKVTRLFSEALRSDSTARQGRPRIEQSHYVAHLGDHKQFEDKLDQSLKHYKALGKGLMCISDGALWLKNYWQKSLPKAQLILDFWHVMDKLATLSRQCLPNEKQRKHWLDQQHNLLLESRMEEVKTNIGQLPVTTAHLEQESQRVLQYIDQNQFRMDYKVYLQQGLRIGSGAVEAAHRTLVQARMKRSGQHWSDKGAQNMLNLRVAYKSGKAHLITQIITGRPASGKAKS